MSIVGAIRFEGWTPVATRTQLAHRGLQAILGRYRGRADLKRAGTRVGEGRQC
jgi:hypothetical protein